VPLAFVVEAHDTTWIGGRRLQPKGHVDSLGKQSLSAAQDERIEQQMELIDQAVLEQRVHELVAPIREDVLAGRCLELPTASTTLSRMIVVLRQMGFLRLFDTTYFAGAFIMSPKRSPGFIGSNAFA
jgi:hypothetical protein